MFELFPVSYRVRANSMHIGQRGLFLNQSLNSLIVGIITENGLKGRVIHNGVTQKDYDGGQYDLSTFMTGYTYDKWNISDMEYVGNYRTYTSIDGYLEFLNFASYEQIKAYFKTKELLKNNKII